MPGTERAETSASRLLNSLRRSGLTLAVAESCTGGLLGARLTDVPGSSEVFRGGIIAYSDAAKVRILGLPEAALRASGAVSEEVAARMADRVRTLFGSDGGISATGIAGPGGSTPGKPVGLVYIGAALRMGGQDRSEVRRLLLEGDRPRIRRQTVDAALELMADLLGADI
jgi:PncC family amidohydrolase